MNKIEEINEILNNCKKNALENLYIEPRVTYIYNVITQYGIDEYQKKINFNKNGYFNFWKEKFGGHIENNLYIISNNFNNKDNLSLIRVTLNIDISRIRISVVKIIDFLNKNNIPYFLNIKDEIRNDGLNIYLKNIKDYEFVREYIDSTSYIHEGLRSNSPFCISDKSIELSYNSKVDYYYFISKILSFYLSNKIGENKIETINCSDFKNFIKKCYNNNEELLEKLNLNYKIKNVIIEDNKSVLELILLSLDEFSDYCSFKNLYIKNKKNKGFNLNYEEKENVILDISGNMLKKFEEEYTSGIDKQDIKLRFINTFYSVLKRDYSNIYDQDIKYMFEKIISRNELLYFIEKNLLLPHNNLYKIDDRYILYICEEYYKLVKKEYFKKIKRK
ncbi:MAG: hypothetical protein PUD59_04405 [bacterium]|nr:hypothetical protein [bacterium]